MNKIQEKMASKILSPRSKTNSLNSEREAFERAQVSCDLLLIILKHNLAFVCFLLNYCNL